MLFLQIRCYFNLDTISNRSWTRDRSGLFLANGITTLATGQDIGQHVDSSVGAYNDSVKAEEQQKFNEAMGY